METRIDIPYAKVIELVEEYGRNEFGLENELEIKSMKTYGYEPDGEMWDLPDYIRIITHKTP